MKRYFVLENVVIVYVIDWIVFSSIPFIYKQKLKHGFSKGMKWNYFLENKTLAIGKLTIEQY